MIEIKQIIRTKRKTIALVIERDGSLIVRAPLRTSAKNIQLLVNEKADWIREKQNLVKDLYPKMNTKTYTKGEMFWYLGKQYPLEVVNHTDRALSLDSRFHLSQQVFTQAKQVFIHWYQSQAAQVISGRVRLYAEKYRFTTYTKIRITSARTRWGSCTSTGTLNFSYRLVMAPLAVIDYVVVHELAHLHQRNHSKNFWNIVEEIVPDYKKHKTWLKTNGYLLTVD